MSRTTDRLPGLDLLRSLAIVWVMLFHSFLLGGLGPDWSWLSRFGWMGVDLFFVLSGLLIGGQVFTRLAADGGQLSLSDFYLRRALRILPAYWVVLALYVLWPGFREAPGIEPTWKFLLFIVNLDIAYEQNAAFSHAWSLCVEEHFYWLFPLAAVLMLKRPSAWRFAALCALIVVGGIALRTLIWLHGAQLALTTPRNWFIEDLYYPTWCRLDGLLCGVALAAFKTFRATAWQRARRHANAAAMAGLLLLVVAFSLFDNRVGLLANTVGWPVLSVALGLIVFSAAARDSVLGRLDFVAARWLAAISYSLYLVHKAVYHVVQQHWGSALQDSGSLAFMVYGGTAVAAGALLHLAVERPCLRLRWRMQHEAR